MADRNSTQKASRRTTPQPTSGNGRTNRTTRSQSRDISDSEEVRLGVRPQRKGRPTSSGTTNNMAGVAVQSSSNGRKERFANEFRALQDLSTVAEDPGLTYPQLDTVEEEEEEEELHDDYDPQGATTLAKSPGGISAFSGTTARTSRSGLDFADMDSGIMLDALPDLAGASDSMLRFLVPIDLSESSILSLMTQVQTKGSRGKKNFDRLFSTLSAQRDSYGSDSYIALSEVLRTLVGGRHPDDDAGPWRPDGLLQKANLAILVAGVFNYSWERQDSHFVEELEQIFPAPFAKGLVSSNDLSIGYSVLGSQTFQVALEIRTQYAIMLFSRHAEQANFDYDVVLRKVFYENAQNLRGWPVVGLRTRDMTREVQDAIVSRLKSLRDTFARYSEGSMAAVEHIQAAFPWGSFVQQTLVWASQRMVELDSQNSANGGAHTICQTLKGKTESSALAGSLTNNDGINDRGTPPIELQYDQPSDASHTASEQQDVPLPLRKAKVLDVDRFNPNSPKVTGAVSALKRLENRRKSALTAEQSYPKENKQPPSNVQSTATAGPSTRSLSPQPIINESTAPSTSLARAVDASQPDQLHEDDWRQQEADDEDDGSPLASEAKIREIGSQVYRMSTQRQAESNKENIEVPMSQPDQSSASGRKRHFIDAQPGAHKVHFDDSQDSRGNDQGTQMSDVSADVGFQDAPGLSREVILTRRGQKPASKRSAEDPVVLQRVSPKKTRVQEPSSSRHLSHTQDRPADEPEPSPLYEEVRSAHAAARERNTIMEKPKQMRKPWSQDEITTLVELIAEYGVSWSLLMKQDNEKVLWKRDQVALKDKARNIKMDFLKAGQMLPPNFDKVSISKKEIERLRAMRIEYDKENGRRADAIGNSTDDDDG